MSRPRRLPSGRWQAYLNVTEGARPRQVALGTFATQRAAKDAIAKAEVDRRRGAFIDPGKGKVTVAAWAQEWYALRRTPSRGVRSFLDARILPYWGDWALRDIETMHIQQWVNSLGGQVAPSTVCELYAMFKAMMERAVKYGRLATNPCDLAPGDLPRRQSGVHVFLTNEEVGMLVALAPDRYRAMVHLAARTGMRIGELLGLQWSAVDLEAGVVDVRQARRGDGSIGAPKNNKARLVVVDAGTVEVLRAHRRDFGGSEFVFTSARGCPLQDANFRRAVWRPLVTAAGLPTELTFHDLRHTHASWLVIAGVDWLVIANRLGHSSPSFTMNTYGRLRPDANAVVLAALEAMAG